MVELPDQLRSVFNAPVRERDGKYVVEIPASEVEAGAVAPGGTYRVAITESPATVSDAPRSPDPEPEPGPSSPDPEPEPAPSPSDPEPEPEGDALTSADREPGRPSPPVEEGETREVIIETVGDQGDGIAKVDRGFVVIVPDAEPGDEPVVEIDQVKENVAFASVVESDSGS